MTQPKSISIPRSTPYSLTPVPELNRALAYTRAIDSLSRYKFIMFGYWAALWVIFNQMSVKKERNPFSRLVLLAREIKGG